MLSTRTSTVAALLAVTVAMTAAGCVPTPAPTASPTATPSESSSPTPSATPTVDPIALPDCDDIYSPAIVSMLAAESRTPIGDVSGPGMGGWGTYDPDIEALLAGIDDRVSCTWILPASESGSTTSIALIDAALKVDIAAGLVAAGMSMSSSPLGDLYSIAVTGDYTSYNESHLVTDEVWVATVYSGGQAEPLTLDAANQILP